MEPLDDYSNYAYNMIDSICSEIGPRYAGSTEELQATKWLENEWSNFCDQVKTDKFKVHPNHFTQGIFTLMIPIAVLAFLSLFLKQPFVLFSAGFSFLLFFLFFFEYMLVTGLLKFLYKKKESQNVFGIIKPQKSVKFRVILDGHTDSAKELPWARRESLGLLVFLCSFAIAFIVFTFVYPIVKVSKYQEILLLGNNYNWFIFEVTQLDLIMIPIGFALLVFFLVVFFGLISNHVVMGANDNLSGTAVASAVGKYFSEHKLNNVELVILSCGSEEIGEKGAKHFVKKHPEFFENAYAVSYECIGAGNKLYIVNLDFSHLTVYSKEINKRIFEAHTDYAQGKKNPIDCEIGNLAVGSCNANKYVKAGFKAAFIIAQGDVHWRPVEWHSRDDTIDCIEKDFLRDMIDISIRFVKQLDEDYS